MALGPVKQRAGIVIDAGTGGLCGLGRSSAAGIGLTLLGRGDRALAAALADAELFGTGGRGGWLGARRLI
ncbi:hypothetical protein, partial [Sphingomonas koreensis]|uniref:hypothetical protein n=1 Tax=Sphingomonas koreensis TaxID=93064 RepID=UPI001002DC62